MVKLKKLTEKEISKLPFPETARAIGGYLYFQDSNISESDIRKIRKQFRESIKNAVWRTPIIGSKDEQK